MCRERFRRNSIQVLNLFSSRPSKERELWDSPKIPERYMNNHYNDEEIKKKERESFMKQLGRFDENVRHAIILRREKDPKSDFYRRLETLNDRINAYKGIFLNYRQPVYMTISNKFKESHADFSKLKKVNSILMLCKHF